MAQPNIDKLLALTDSRYRLTIVAAKRAAQLRKGFPTLLSTDEQGSSENALSLALKELELGKGLVWGTDLPDLAAVGHQVHAEEGQALPSDKRRLTSLS